MAGKDNESKDHSCKDLGSFLVLLAEMEDSNERIRALTGSIEEIGRAHV